MAVHPFVFAEAHEDTAGLLQLTMLYGDLASVECSPSFLFTFYILILEGCGQREVTLGRSIAVHNLPS